MKLILILGFWGCVLYSGGLVIKSAQEQTDILNAIQVEKRETINATLPGSCTIN